MIHPEKQVSPKVSWAALGGLGAALLIAIITKLMVDPNAAGFVLPTWGTFLLMTCGPVIVSTLVGYLKRDPLRNHQPPLPGETAVSESSIRTGAISSEQVRRGRLSS